MTPEYTVELWDWKSKKYIADISSIIDGSLSIEWAVNDVESVSFSIDLVQFERKCQLMGVQPEDVLTPYVHDVRIKRNGTYIIGAQVVDADIDIPNDGRVVINVKCTGFLNLFKDRYITMPMGTYSYSGIARRVVQLVQLNPGPVGIAKNPSGDIDTAYWIGYNGVVTRDNSGHVEGESCIRCQLPSGTGWVTACTQLYCPANTPLNVSVWVWGQANRTMYIRERQYINDVSTQIIRATRTMTGSWTQMNFSFTTKWDKPYLTFEVESTTATGRAIAMDNLFVSYQDDIGCNFNVALGSNSTYQPSDATRNLQDANVKDLIKELSALGDYPFDFEFNYDRTFITTSRVGSKKPWIEATYPGNIDSMSIKRSAANVANKIVAIGSGIGDERLEYHAIDPASCDKLANRVSMLTYNNVSELTTLQENANKELQDLKYPTNLPKITISDGSINPSNTKIGDSIMLNIDNHDTYLNSVNGMYRIMKYSLTYTQNGTESVTFELESES